MQPLSKDTPKMRTHLSPRIDIYGHFLLTQVVSGLERLNHYTYPSLPSFPLHSPEPSVTTARARSFSSGFLPACCPLAFFWNILLFWVPFSGNGFNTRRIKLLRETMQQLTVEVTSKKTCSCVEP